MKEESEKVGLKLNIQKTKNMAPGSITSWQIHGETMETVVDFFFSFFFFWTTETLHMVTTAMKLKGTCSLEEKLDQPSSVQFSSVAQSCPTLCDPMNRSTPDFPVHHQLPEFTQTHVHPVRDAIQPSHPLSSPSPPAPNPSQQQSLFQ